MLNTISHQGIVHQNHNEIPTKLATIKKRQELVKVWKNWNHQTLLVGIQNGRAVWQIAWHLVKILSIKLPYNPFLDI